MLNASVEETVRWWLVIKAGLMHLFNPASLLGWVIFFILLVFLRSRCRRLSFFLLGSIPALFSFELFVHIGLFDLWLGRTAVLAFWDMLRVVVAIAVMIGSAFLFRFWRGGGLQKPQTLEYLDQWIKNSGTAGGGKKEAWASAIRLLFLGTGIGIFLAFFQGTWPLDDVMVQLLYQGTQAAPEDLFRKIFVFELINIVPVFLVIAAVEWILKGRFMDYPKRLAWGVVVFAALCVGMGAGVILSHIEQLI